MPVTLRRPSRVEAQSCVLYVIHGLVSTSSMTSVLKTPVNISLPWNRICWHLALFSFWVTEVRFWTGYTYWQGVLEGGFLNGHVEELNWITYLRRKIWVLHNEKKLYFVFSLSLLSPAFWVLAFGYVLIQLRLFPKHFSGLFPNLGPVA